MQWTNGSIDIAVARQDLLDRSSGANETRKSFRRSLAVHHRAPYKS
jgi:hypothetical protein